MCFLSAYVEMIRAVSGRYNDKIKHITDDVFRCFNLNYFWYNKISDDGSFSTCDLPRKGVVYVISGFEYSSHGTYLCLCGFEDDSFLSDSFRPVVERPTSISVFKAMLSKPRIGVDA